METVLVLILVISRRGIDVAEKFWTISNQTSKETVILSPRKPCEPSCRKGNRGQAIMWGYKVVLIVRLEHRTSSRINDVSMQLGDNGQYLSDYWYKTRTIELLYKGVSPLCIPRSISGSWDDSLWVFGMRWFRTEMLMMTGAWHLSLTPGAGWVRSQADEFKRASLMRCKPRIGTRSKHQARRRG